MKLVLPNAYSIKVEEFHVRVPHSSLSVRIGGKDGKVNETILPKLTMVLLQMGLDCMFNGIFVEGPTCNYNGLGRSDFVVGLEENIFNLKTMTILL